MFGQRMSWLPVAAVFACLSLAVCAQDAYEPDNTTATATYAPADATIQTHDFQASGDVDWFVTHLEGGKSYTIWVENLPPTQTNTDLVLDVYDVDSVTTSSPPDLYFDHEEWHTTSATAGFLFFRVSNIGVYGDATSYTVKITRNTGGNFGLVYFAAAHSRSLTLRWENLDFSGVVGYNVRRSLHSSYDYVQVNTALISTDTTTYVDANLQPSTTYHYVVYPNNGGDMEDKCAYNVGMTLAPPAIDVSPGSMPFGSCAVGAATDPSTATIHNLGVDDLTLTSITIIGADKGQFAFAAEPLLNPVTSVSLQVILVRFSPSTPGPKTAALRIESDDPTSGVIDIPLTGTGEPTVFPDIDVSTTSLSFGPWLVGAGPTAPSTVTIGNLDEGLLTFTTITIEGPDESQFAFAGGAPSLDPLTSGSSRQVFVQFQPSAGGLMSASLRIESNDPDESIVQVALSGQGLAPDIHVTPGFLAFGSCPVGSSTGPSTVTIENLGDADLTFTSITLTGADKADFAFSGAAPSLDPLTTDSTRQIAIVFHPASLGGKSASLTIVSNDPDEGTKQVPLSGAGGRIGSAAHEWERY